MSGSPRLNIMAAMPAYNEEKYVGSLVLQLKQYARDVIVVDDGSTDRTSKIAGMAGAVVVKHPENRGYGAAIQSILAEAKKRDPDVLVILDADSQHNPDEIPYLVEAIAAGSDIVVGSRKTSGAIPAYRRFGLKVLTALTRISSREKLSDTESGFRAYSRKAIASLKLKEKGMAISSEIISVAASQGLRITEIPISVTYTRDSSTMNPVMHGMSVLNRIFLMISERRPLLTFGIIGAILIAFGILMGVLVVATLRTAQVLQTGSALLSMLFITTGVLSISTGIILSVLVRRLDNARRTNR